ncbi:PQQ-binding-like beta-propeller repeat protein, partial [bacterium]|nr:PQQ-binding-like beta-propeller repeat protein [bacterium]
LVRALAASGSIVWHYQPGAGEVDTSPGVCDLNGDGSLDIIVCSTAGRITAVDAQGKQQWYYDARQTISNPPALWMARRQPRVTVVTNPGKVICLDGRSGSRLWDYSMPAEVDWGSTAPVAADMNGDGVVELVVADRTGNLICLSDDGSLQWSARCDGGLNSAPALADINADGEMEILLGSAKSPLICFSHTGQELWRAPQSAGSGSSPVVTDLESDGAPEIVVGIEDGLAVYSRTGKRLWHHRMKKPVHDAIAVADIDDDDRKEIVVADLFGHVACLEDNGAVKWTANAEQRVRRSPAIADIDGDSVVEILIGGYSAALHIFDPDGNLKERFPLHASMNAMPTVVDFKGNEQKTVLCAAGSRMSAISWMAGPPQRSSPALWTFYRVDSGRTGSDFIAAPSRQPRITAIDYGPMYIGANHLKVTVKNPASEPLQLALALEGNNAGAQESTIRSADSVFTAILPYSLNGQSAVNLTFKCRLSSGKKRLASREKSFYVIPFAKDLADLSTTLADIEAAIPTLPDQAFVQEQLLVLNHRFTRIAEKSRTAGTLPVIQRSALQEDVAALRTDANRWLATARAAAKAGTALAIYGANPWAPFGGMEEIVEGRTWPAARKLECFGNEIESAAFNIANFSGQSMTVLISMDPLRSAADSNQVLAPAGVFSFHEVLNVPTETLDYSADALPVIGQARTLVIPAWEMRQLWINVHSDSLPAGDWRCTLRVHTLQIESQATSASLTIKRWPFSPAQPQPLRLCHWGYVHTSLLKDQPQAALEDQISHGTNVFVATGDQAPQARYDEEGNLVGAINFSTHDEYMSRHAQHGIILFFNYQTALKGPAPHFSPAWAKAYKAWLRVWVQHLQELGVGYENYALYPIDEPGLNEGLVEAFIQYAKPVREVNPSVQIYTDPVERATLQELQKMAPYVDIWCPNRNGYLLHQGAEKLAFLKSTGSTVWTYECEGNAKHQSPLGYYRAQSWLTWFRGLTGIGFWSYCTHNKNPWFMPDGGHDYLLIYSGRGVVSSKRWEAIRDGIEEYGLLVQLQKAVDAAAAKPEAAKAVAAARNILTEQASVLARYCGLDKAGTLPGMDGMAALRTLEDRRHQKITQVRNSMANAFDQLSEYSTSK